MHIIKVCQGGSCRANYGEESLKRAETMLGIKAGEETSDGKIRLETCGCLSNCERGPNVFIGSQAESPLAMMMNDGTVENHMTPKNLAEKILEIKNQTPPSPRLPNL